MPKLLRGTGMSIRRIRQLAVMVEQGDTSLEAHIAFFSERGGGGRCERWPGRGRSAAAQGRVSRSLPGCFLISE
jgi:hypothetical protein